MNAYVGEGRTEEAEELISSSDVICIFGMSLGETDGMWWTYITDWLYEKGKILIIYDYDTNAEYLSGSQIADYIMSVRDRFIEAGIGKQANVHYQIRERIFVIRNSSLFDFKAA